MNITSFFGTQQILEKAVNDFLHLDRELLINNAHEQAIAHRIAVYIEKQNIGFDVDCEYNKQAKDIKRWGKRIFRPDIIVHRRGRNERGDNLLAVEIKKDKICKSNLARLKFMTKPNNSAFGYNLGCFLFFNKEKPQYIWVDTGHIVKDL